MTQDRSKRRPCSWMRSPRQLQRRRRQCHHRPDPTVGEFHLHDAHEVAEQHITSAAIIGRYKDPLDEFRSGAPKTNRRDRGKHHHTPAGPPQSAITQAVTGGTAAALPTSTGLYSRELHR